MRLESQKEKKINSKLNHALKQPSQSRRSFAKAGFVAPVILSLPNRSAWGANVRCTASGFGSLVEIMSGIDVADITCNYSDSSIIKKENLITKAKQKKLGDLFGCSGGPNQDITVKQALTGSDSWLINMVIAFYNAEPETTTTFTKNNGKVVTRRDLKVGIPANNPFGAGCPVEDVFCHFEGGAITPVRIGSNTEMTKDEANYFLSVVLYQ